MRPHRPLHLMKYALLASERSTCHRLNVGAIIVDADSRAIISNGYNGPPSGEEHCNGKDCPFHVDVGCRRSIHAEKNAIDKAVFREDGNYDLYVTHSPCDACATMIYHRRNKIQRLFYGIEYRNPTPLASLSRVMEIYKVTPAGYVTQYGLPHLIDPESLYDRKTQ